MLVERTSSRPRRLGTTRRKAKGLPSASAPHEAPGRQARSLDNSKQLATSVLDWLQSTETALDKYRLKCYQQAILLRSLFKLWQGGGNPLREKDYYRVEQCQRQWIGFPTTCCKSAVAVPIGCNHRLCFLCNSHRAEKYRERVRVMFDRLEHPIFLTLTIPNVRTVTKRTYNTIRIAIRKLLKQHSGWINGGLYSLETTYNRNSDSRAYGTWHVHAHILIDSRCPLPTSRAAFIKNKRRIEYDWLLFTGGRKLGWRDGDFNYWFHQTCEGKRDNPDRHQWNCLNRRVIDIRRVTNREKAAHEVLKYITKGADFADLPNAVEQFLTAVKGTRMIQTFGSWYGFKFTDDVNSWGHLECGCGRNEFAKDETGKLIRIVLFREQVEMNMALGGKWQVRPMFMARGSPISNYTKGET